MFHILLIFLIYSMTYGANTNWYILARDDGCIDIQIIVRELKLSRTPISPEDFVQMMKERGENVTVDLPIGISPNLEGKLVQVRFGKAKSLLFVKDEICHGVEFGKK
ncbi:MAG: hypothetical protein PHO27_09050 [Sulfuricurvum sp.]|nr:hypothetical protein [Sulfuricurvum sp.]